MYQLPPLSPEEILIYLRKSRADDPLMTVEDVLMKHEQMLDKWISDHLRTPTGEPYDRTVPPENRLREVASGETIAQRPKMQELLHRIESPACKAVLIVEPQRLSRGDLEDIGRISKIFRYTRTIIITLQYIYDPSDARDRDDLERELKRGNEYLEYTKNILNRGRILASENGAYVGNVPPYGYRRICIRVPGSRKDVYTLEPDEDQAETVRTVFSLYNSGLGSTSIARRLDAMGIPAPGSTHWSTSTITSILDNPVYIGKIRWNHRSTVRTIRDGTVINSRPRAHGDTVILADGHHKPIITQEAWDAAHERRGSVPKTNHSLTLRNPLAGLLFCGKCGRAMQYRTYKNHGIEKTAPRYLCDYQPICHNGSVTVREAIDEVKRSLSHAICDFEQQKKGEAFPENQEIPHTIVRIHANIQTLKDQQLNLWREKTSGRIPEDIFNQLYEETTRKINESVNALDQIEKHLSEETETNKRIRTFYDALNALNDPASSAEEQNSLLKSCIARIDFIRERNGHQFSPFTVNVTFKL